MSVDPDEYLFGRKRKRSVWLGQAMGAGLGAGVIAGSAALGQPAIGGFLSPFARNLGLWGGDVIKTFTGFGSYNVEQNSLFEGAQAPFVRNYDLTGGTVVTHREYVCDIITSATPGEFKLQGFNVNAGLPTLFEFLAQLAVNYEEYVVEGLIFTYKPTSCESTNSTNIALGSVLMATQYNPLLPDFTGKAEMLSSQYSMTCRPSEMMCHPIECATGTSITNHMYIRSGTIPSGADLRLYDFCRFQIATQGFQGASVNCGELHVSYQFALLKPRLFAALGQYNDYFLWGSTDMTTNAIFGSGNNASATLRNISISFANGVNTSTLTFPAYPQPVQYYLFCKWVYNPGAVINDVTFTNPVNITLSTEGIFTAPLLGDTSRAYVDSIKFTTSGGCFVPTLDVNLGAFPVGCTSCWLLVTQIPNTM